MGTANKRLNHKSIITVGTDLFYNSSLKPILDTMGYDPSNIGDVMQFGISVGHHLTLGILVLSLTWWLPLFKI